MRTRLTGFIVAVALLAAAAGLTAAPASATSYFVKYLQASTDSECTNRTLGARHGSVVFKRTATTMSATVYLKDAEPNTEYLVLFWACKATTATGTPYSLTTDGQGNGTAQLGPEPLKNVKTFFVEVALNPFNPRFSTASVPAHGY
jgi:hypothetical protein